MRLFFLVVLLIGVSTTATSQIDFMDSPPGKLDIPVVVKGADTKSSAYQSNQNHSLTAPKYRNGFSNPTDFFKKEKEPLTMTAGHGLMERTIKFEPNYLQKNKDRGGTGNQNTQYLGKFTSTGKYVEIYCRDHQYVDGDRVQVLINGNIVAQSITLTGSYQPVLVVLGKGANRIEIKALNEGTSSPNTAQFVVYDEMGNIITKNQWNLATGVEASILINKP